MHVDVYTAKKDVVLITDFMYTPRGACPLLYEHTQPSHDP